VERPLGGHVLDGRIPAEQIRGRDVVDVRIVDGVVQRQLQSFDVAGVRLDEDVEILGRAGQSVEVQRDRADDGVVHAARF